MMENLKALGDRLPEVAKDLRLNLLAVLEQSTLDPEPRWGVALASAYASQQGELTRALLADARAASIGDGIVDDARAAAVLMGMNNVYYRGRHFMGEPYGQKPARLRMNRLAQPSSKKEYLELFSLAVSAINGCEACVKAHEKAARAAGLSEDQVFDALRIAAVVNGVAVGLSLNTV